MNSPRVRLRKKFSVALHVRGEIKARPTPQTEAPLAYVSLRLSLRRSQHAAASVAPPAPERLQLLLPFEENNFVGLHAEPERPQLLRLESNAFRPVMMCAGQSPVTIRAYGLEVEEMALARAI